MYTRASPPAYFLKHLRLYERGRERENLSCLKVDNVVLISFRHLLSLMILIDDVMNVSTYSTRAFLLIEDLNHIQICLYVY